MKRLKPLDFVKTPAGNFAIVTTVNERGSVSIDFIGSNLMQNGYTERNAWWDYKQYKCKKPYGGLVYIGNLPYVLANAVKSSLVTGAKENVLKHFKE